MADDRKTFFVSVGAGQVLEDREAASFEFEIRASHEELNKLQESILRYGLKPVTEGEEELNGAYDSQIHDIYKLLHELGTDETKRHIESMNVLEPTAEHDCMEEPC
jgi:hypothetical protein